MTSQREYAEADLRELKRIEVRTVKDWRTLVSDPDDNVGSHVVARVVLANLRARLPKLLALWDAVSDHEQGKSWDRVTEAIVDLNAPLHGRIGGAP